MAEAVLVAVFVGVCVLVGLGVKVCVEVNVCVGEDVLVGVSVGWVSCVPINAKFVRWSSSTVILLSTISWLQFRHGRRLIQAEPSQ